MNFTLFGYPKTGKTTLFNLLTGAGIEVKAFDDGKREPNLRTCPIPDKRLDRISSLYPDKKRVPAAIDFIDLAGISFGEVKTSLYLGHLRRADSLVHVTRGFSDVNIPHIKDRISPQEDIRFMEEELILADMASIESRLDKLEKELKKTKDPEGEKEKEILESLRQSLLSETAIREVPLSPADEKHIRHFAFLSQKPLIHMVNVDETQIPRIETPEEFYPSPKKGTTVLAFCGKIESEILELEEEEKAIFLAEYGLKELSAPRFFKTAYELIEIITFFTVGKDEVRAWTVKKETPAHKAAGSIHSDIERGFIRAEVISCTELFEHGSLQAAKEKGVIRLEGKDYPVQDGDVIYFRFAS